MAFGAGGANPFRGVNRPAPPVRTGPRNSPNRNPNPNRGQNRNQNQNPNRNKGPGQNKNPGKGKGGGHQPKVNPNSFAANPFSYTAPYSKAEKSQARGIANAQTKGPIAALASQRATNVAANQAGQQTDFGYYMSLAKAAQDAVATQGQIGAGLNSTLAGIGANTQQTLSSLGAAQQGGAVGRFNALGLGGDSAAQIAATQAQQQGLGALNSQAFQSAGALQSGNYQSYANQMPGVAALSGQEQIGNLARAGALANSTIDAQIAAKRAGAGSAYATALGQIRQQEVSGNLAQQTLGVTAANEAARNSLTARGQTLSHQDHLATIAAEKTRALISARTSAANSRRSANTSAANNAADNATRKLLANMKQNASGGPGGGGKPATTAARQAVFGHVDYLTGEIQRLKGAGYSDQEAYHLVQNGSAVPVVVGHYTDKFGVKKPLTLNLYPNRLGTQILNMAFNARPGGSGLSPGDLAYLRSIGIFNETRYPRSKGGGGQVNSGGGQSTRPPSASDVNTATGA